MVAKKVLIAEDTPLLAESMQYAFDSRGIDTDVALSYEEAVEFVKSNKYDLYVLDSLEGDYIPLRELILAENPDSKVILLTGSSERYRQGKSLGIESYKKPKDVIKIFDLV